LTLKTTPSKKWYNTSIDIRAAYIHKMNAAENAGLKEKTLERIRQLIADKGPGNDFVSKILVQECGLNK
jgi:hypothetical protein